MEYKFFGNETPYVSTFAFHKDRERAPHIDQTVHQGRLARAEHFVHEAAGLIRHDRDDPHTIIRVVDLGCGDGGLLSKLAFNPLLDVHGYDFQPSNVAGWEERGVSHAAEKLNFVENWNIIKPADVYVITECLEHLADPHAMVKQIRDRFAYIVASSPWTETALSHDECHAWAWDPDGYRVLLEQAEFDVIDHDKSGMFQIILGAPRA